MMKPQLFKSLKGYKKKDLLNDLTAGLMVAIIAMPLSIALGLQSVPESVSNYGVNYGIVTAIIAGFFISLLGGSKFQIGGPTAAFVVILYGYIINPKIGLLGLAIAGVMAGIILILMGVFKLGKVMKIFPYPIAIGFTTGIGITLIIGQIKDFCGFNGTGASVIEKISAIVKNISSFNIWTFLVGVVGLMIVILLPKISKKIPSSFVALIVCTLLTLLLNETCDAEIMTIGKKYGDIKAEFILPDFKNVKNLDFSVLIIPSIVIALLCAIESLLSATVASGMTNTAYDANQELVGQGVANIFSSLLGGLPATGAIARTAANIENKAKSPFSGISHAVFLLIMYFLLMGVIKYVPLAVFSAILISVAINMSRFPKFFRLMKFSVKDTVVLIVTCIITVIFDLTYGVLGAFVLATLMNINRIIHPAKITRENNVITIFGSLIFYNANKLVTTINQAFEEYDGIEIDFAKVYDIDLTCLEKLDTVLKNCPINNKSVTIKNLDHKKKVMFYNISKI